MKESEAAREITSSGMIVVKNCPKTTASAWLAMVAMKTAIMTL